MTSRTNGAAREDRGSASQPALVYACSPQVASANWRRLHHAEAFTHQRHGLIRRSAERRTDPREVAPVRVPPIGQRAIALPFGTGERRLDGVVRLNLHRDGLDDASQVAGDVD